MQACSVCWSEHCEHGAELVRFDSAGEYRRWLDLRLLERAAQIHELERQVRLELVVDGTQVCRLVVDFRYRTLEGVQLEDFKGYETPVSRLKRRLAAALGHRITLYPPRGEPHGKKQKARRRRA